MPLTGVLKNPDALRRLETGQRNVAAVPHWLNSIPNALISEFVAEENTNLYECVSRQRLRACESYLAIPQEPGLGIELDQDAIRRFRVA